MLPRTAAAVTPSHGGRQRRGTPKLQRAVDSRAPPGYQEQTVAEALRFGLIGCGGIARGHLGAYGHRFEMVACCDLYEPAVRDFHRQFGFRRTYTDFRAMLEAERLDFVTVCTSSTHDRLDIVLACAATGTHVLVEKPMALTPGQARRMVAACSDAGVKLAVSQQYRNFPHVKAAYDLLRSGTIGQPFLGELRMAHLGWFPLKGAKRSDSAKCSWTVK